MIPLARCAPLPIFFFCALGSAALVSAGCGPAQWRPSSGSGPRGLRSIKYPWMRTGHVKAEGRDGPAGREGRWRFNHPTGKLRIRCGYRAGSLHGAWEKRYESGAIEERGQYVGGKRTGRWTWYYASGKAYLTGSYQHGQRHSTWEMRDARGNLWWQGTFRAGQKHGRFSAYTSGVLVEQGHFARGQRHGPWKSFHPNGKLRADGRYHHGRRTGRWRVLDPRGKLLEVADLTSRRPGPPSPPATSMTDALSRRLAALETKVGPELRAEAIGHFLMASELSRVQTDRIKRYSIQWAASHLMRDFFTTPPARGAVTLYLFRSTASYYHYSRTWHGRVPLRAAGFATSKAIYANIATGTGTLIHELVHVFLKADFPRVPIWFNEGLATLYEQSAELNGKMTGLINWRLKVLARALRARRLVGLARLLTLTHRAFSGPLVSVHYAQVRYLVYYLQQRRVLRTFYRRYRANQRQDPWGTKTLVAVLGAKDLADVERQVLRFEARLIQRAFPTGLPARRR